VSSRWHLPARRQARVIIVMLAVIASLTTTGFVVAALAAPNFPGPPRVSISFPASFGAYNAAGWAAGCTPAGICGSAASDSSPVTSVAVGIYQASSGRYWDGSAFSARALVFNTAIGTNSWDYPFTPPSDGDYTVYAQAYSRFGPSQWAVVSFSYDTVPPNTPDIVGYPANPTTSTSASFVFTDNSGPDISFSCYLDSAAAAPCNGGTWHESNWVVAGRQDYTGLAPGKHCFYVYATDRAGNASPPASYCWTITITVTSSPFGVGGNLTSPLYPGTSEPLNLTFTNPNSSAITIASGGVGGGNISISSNAAGCGPANFEVLRGLTASVTIPADQTAPMSLSALGVPQADWPVIEMIDTDSNQDACEGARLTLTYSGIGATG
jgi:hypothetical protein